VQYRGEIMPLIPLQEILGFEAADNPDSNGSLQVLVYSERGKCVGMVVDRILDIVEEAVTVERKVQRNGRGDGGERYPRLPVCRAQHAGEPTRLKHHEVQRHMGEGGCAVCGTTLCSLRVHARGSNR